MKKRQVSEQVENYLGASTVHGVQYWSKKEGASERILWSVIVVAFFIIAAYMIAQSFQVWNESPLVFTFSITVPNFLISFRQN